MSRRKTFSSPLAPRELPVRRARHGRIMVGMPNRDHYDQRPSPYWVLPTVKRSVTANPDTGKYEAHTTTLAPLRLMTLEEVQRARASVPRARTSTIKKGKRNARSKEELTKYLGTPNGVAGNPKALDPPHWGTM